MEIAFSYLKDLFETETLQITLLFQNSFLQEIFKLELRNQFLSSSI